MRLHILLTVIVALIAGMAGTAAAGERGRHQSITPHAGIKLHAGHHRSAIVPGFRHHQAKRIHRIRPAEPRFAHDRSWRSDGKRRLGFKKFRRDHFAGKHRRHFGHRPLVHGSRHGGGQVVVVPVLRGAIEVIIGSDGRHILKRHRHFSERRDGFSRRHRGFARHDHGFSKHHRRFRD